MRNFKENYGNLFLCFLNYKYIDQSDNYSFMLHSNKEIKPACSVCKCLISLYMSF